MQVELLVPNAKGWMYYGSTKSEWFPIIEYRDDFLTIQIPEKYDQHGIKRIHIAASLAVIHYMHIHNSLLEKTSKLGGKEARENQERLHVTRYQIDSWLLLTAAESLDGFTFTERKDLFPL